MARKAIPARGRRALIGFVLVMLVLLLLVDGFTTKTVGASSEPPDTSATSALAGQRPILVYAGRGRLKSDQPLPGRRIALTFDDGPSAEWTPQIARILLREHVPATFFEVGSQVVRNQGIVRALYDDGFELGNHTFTHVDLAMLPNWERQLQVSLTESAIGGITGIRPRLVRPPYSSTTDAVTPSDEAAWASVASHGYTIVVTNYDAEDWTRPGVGQIVANVIDALPKNHDEGGIVLMHDAGGNRAETVAALPILIARLRALGYSFVRVSDLGGLSTAAVEVPVAGLQRLRGQAFDVMLAIAGIVTRLLTLVVFGVTVLVALRMLAGLVLARVHVRRTARLETELDHTPPVSILVPAYNEAVGIERAVRSLAGSQYAGTFEVVVIDDGSTDATAEIVEALSVAPDLPTLAPDPRTLAPDLPTLAPDPRTLAPDLPTLAPDLPTLAPNLPNTAAAPRVRLLRQANTGKAAALNRGLAASRSEIVVTVDGDTLFEPDSLTQLVQRFREPDVGAISGNTKVGNRRGLIGRWQHIEYVMGFNLDRRMYEVLGATPTVPGAIGAFRRTALADIGGVSGATLAEDTDITLDIGRAGWQVVYAGRARAWTEAPSTLRGLYRQRQRWAYGTFQSIWKHRAALRRPDEGRVGTRAIPYLLLFQVALPLTAPLIDLFAVYSILFLDPWPILGFWLAFNAFQLVLAWSAFGFDGESRRPLWALPLQQFVYRQIMYLVVLDAAISALMGSRLGWQRVERTGDVELAPRT
jgi:cellulose synthase/poly-beta-1,6-N-acetylglucosamine synthase-like glycosyltransferase/peptidoglycan/xylan/chitin deacetylase (PgdA/CDA1 family)